MNRIVLTTKGQEIITRANVDGNPQYWVGYFGLAYVPESGSTPLAERTTLVDQDENGDYIYNIWQGDLTGTGNASAKADSGFTGLTAYDSNLSANFRYVYDPEHLCNRLVAWETEGEAAEGVKADSFRRKGYAVYEGCKATVSTGSDTDTVQFSKSSIPVPAPLLYLGSTLNYGGELSDISDTLDTDWPMMTVSDTDIPMVTPDMRCYGGKVNPASPGTASIDQLVDSETARADQYVQDGCMANYANMVSASVYNKGHCQVSSEGYETDFQESCHNMSRVTKLFPISQYEVADVDPETKSGRKGDASTIKYHLSLDFKGLNATYNDVLNFHGEGSELYDGSYRNSFKFNRIGIYAVPVSVRRFRKEGGCDLCQVEVEPEKNPVLVAIITVDEVLLSEDGSIGFTSWSQDFILNMNTVPADSGSLVRDVEVYYNLAENEAITWYQNQLLATAGLSEAVTSLGIDVAYLKNMAPAASATCCQGAPAVSGDSAYASIYHTHDYMKNLVDALGKGMAVRGADSLSENGYGQSSFTMGFESKTTSDFAITNGPYALNAGDFSINIGPSAKNYGKYSINMVWSSVENHADRVINLGGGTISSSESNNLIQLSSGGGINEESENSIILTASEQIDYLCRSIVLTGGQQPDAENVLSDTIWLGPPVGTLSDANVKESLIIGNGNVGVSQFTLNQVYSIGDTQIHMNSNYDADLYGKASLNRVSIIGLNNPVISDGLTGHESTQYDIDLCTHTYSDAHIFLNNHYYNIPELFGIFPTPTANLGMTGYGGQYMPIDLGAFGEDNLYNGTTSRVEFDDRIGNKYDYWASNKSLSYIQDMINKPANVPMIYTGGIALAGEARTSKYGNTMSENDAGRIKLGNGIVPSAYVTNNPVARWNSTGRYFIPPIVTGTTVCPYGGMKLGITHIQEIDGTMHLALFKDTGLTTAFATKADFSSPWPATGSRYNITAEASPVEFPVPLASLTDGDEFIVAIAEDGASITYPDAAKDIEMQSGNMYLPATTISTQGYWLMRVVSSSDTFGEPYGEVTRRGYLAIPLGGSVS